MSMIKAIIFMKTSHSLILRFTVCGRKDNVNICDSLTHDAKMSKKRKIFTTFFFLFFGNNLITIDVVVVVVV
jgi:uncharacterized protein (DUF1810 family)